MSSLINIARAIRHHPSLRHADSLWDAIRKPYHALLNWTGGVKLVAGGITISVPAEYGTHAGYEEECVAAYANWLRDNPGGLVLDVGSAFGYYSLVALFADPNTHVIAFESDLASIADARKFCRFGPDIGRLSFIHGLVGNDQPVARSAKAAIDDTREKLAVSNNLDHPKFVCLGDAGADAVPRYRLDDLFADEVSTRPILIKCDVEGAEQLVLLGAQQFIVRTRPTILLSVHPWINRYGHTKEDVETLLARMDYGLTPVAIDHALHWMCEPRG